MQDLTQEGRRIVGEVAQRNGVSDDAVYTLLQALIRGGGTMAQFSHPDLGGMGQWSRGGMIMVGDMFNSGLKYRVDSLCNELSNLLNQTNFFVPPPSQSQYQSSSGSSSGFSLFVPGSVSGNWWPGDLGSPSSSGSQNNMRYAVFPDRRRLAIDVNGQVTVYDTGDHYISGFSQQQSGDQSLTFNSQYGLVRVSDLPIVSPGWNAPPPPPPPQQFQPQFELPPPPQFQPQQQQFQPPPTEPPSQNFGNAPSSSGPSGDVFATIERLAELRAKGLLTDEEFASKKNDLLSRL